MKDEPIQSEFKTTVVVALLVVLWIANRPLDDYDIFTQVTLGKQVLSEGMVFKESLVFSLDGEVVLNPGWLWQLLFAWVSTDLHWILFSLIHLALFGCTFLVLSSCRIEEDSCSDRSHAVGALIDTTILWMLGIANNTSFRPQVVALLCLVIVYKMLIFSRETRVPWLTLGCILFFWQNCHLSVVLAGPIILTRFVRQFSRIGFWKGAREAILLFALLCVAHIGTPLGLGVFTLSESNYEISHDLLAILEWHAIWEYGFQEMWAFWFLQVVTTVLVVINRKKIPRSQWCILVMYWLAALFAARFVLVWSCMLFPLWRFCIQNVSQKHKGASFGYRFLSVDPRFQRVAALVIGMVIASGVLTRPLYSEKIPFECIQALDPNHSRVFVQREWAGPIAYTFNGAIQTQADGRLYLYSPDFWRENTALTEGRLSSRLLREKFLVNQVMIDAVQLSRLQVQLEESDQWYVTYQKDSCTIFAVKENEDA